MHEIKIESVRIGASHPPFVIAEMSGNHGQDIDKALRLVDAAAQAGAHALKLQTYTADTMTLDIAEGDFFIDDANSLWRGQSLYSLYQQAYTPWEWHEALFERARAHGMIAFSTPFDDSSVEFLETLNVPCYKIASFENGDIPLIQQVAATGKPLILSTGTATLQELTDAVSAARDAGCNDLILLKCTSNYPADPEDANLLTLPFLEQHFHCVTGVSDHTLGTVVPIASIALGARVIEKHLALDRTEQDVDAAFSLEPHEFARLVQQARLAWTALGTICCEPSERELASRRHRRSLYVVQDIKAGQLFTPSHLRAIRPGAGLPPKHLKDVIGSIAAVDAARGTPLSWDLVRTASAQHSGGQS